MKSFEFFASLVTEAPPMSLKVESGSYNDRHRSIYRMEITKTVIFSLLFTFILIISIGVIKKAGRQDKTLIAMLICLQMSALSKYFPIINYHHISILFVCSCPR